MTKQIKKRLVVASALPLTIVCTMLSQTTVSAPAATIALSDVVADQNSVIDEQTALTAGISNSLADCISESVTVASIVAIQQEETASGEAIKEEEPSYTEYSIPAYSGFKSWMSYKTITNTSSAQYLLQQIAYTGDYGIRMIDGRYCVALGTHFNAEIGTYFQIELENGTILECILADIKADIHTDYSNIFTIKSDCCSEFIVDMNYLDSKAMYRGSMSAVDETWDSPVKYIRIYEENILK